jgi:hypothetical protein
VIQPLIVHKKQRRSSSETSKPVKVDKQIVSVKYELQRKSNVSLISNVFLFFWKIVDA